MRHSTSGARCSPATQWCFLLTSCSWCPLLTRHLAPHTYACSIHSGARCSLVRCPPCQWCPLFTLPLPTLRHSGAHCSLARCMPLLAPQWCTAAHPSAARFSSVLCSGFDNEFRRRRRSRVGFSLGSFFFLFFSTALAIPFPTDNAKISKKATRAQRSA